MLQIPSVIPSRQLAFAVLLSAVTALAACADSDTQDGDESDAGTDLGSSVPGDQDVYEPTDASPDAQVCQFTNPPDTHAAITLTPAFDGLLTGEIADNITQLVASPLEDGRWYYSLRGGQVYTFAEGDEAVALVVDISPAVELSNRELGLFAVAIDPLSADAPQMYLTYSAKPEGSGNHLGRIARFPLDTDTQTAHLDDQEIIWQVVDPSASHNINQASFGPDNMLYFSVGDGGNPNDRYRNGQNTETLFATIARIDPRNPTDERPYSIPDDNPFAVLDDSEGSGDDSEGSGDDSEDETDNAAQEIWAWGLRNPWRFSFDSETGALYVGDVGQDAWEEVNRVEGGENFGWPLREGPDCLSEDPCEGDFTEPVWAYTHAEGASISLGFVYRGEAIPELYGHLFAADFANGSIWSIDLEPETGAQATLQLESGLNIATFAEGHDHEMYVLRYAGNGNGQVFRIDPAPERTEEDTFPRQLSDTGCVDMEDPLAPVPGLLPFRPAARLWSDGAEKARFMYVPPDRRIDVQPDGDFHLPVGSVLVKHFGFDDVIHETRLLIHHENGGWRGYSYRWDEDGDDATLLESSFTENLPNDVRWLYPSRSQCNQCHTEQAGIGLGLEVLQFGLPYAALEDGTPQMDVLRDFDLFNEASLARIDALEDERDPMPTPFGDADLDRRARAYLHANCAGCHRPDGPSAQGDLDLRYTTPMADRGICDELPTQGTLYRPDGDDLRLLIPGDADHSILWLRMETTDVFRMPALGTVVPHDDGLALIREWIESIDDCP